MTAIEAGAWLGETNPAEEYPRRIRFACEECDAIITGLEDHEGLCPYCECYQSVPCSTESVAR